MIRNATTTVSSTAMAKRSLHAGRGHFQGAIRLLPLRKAKWRNNNTNDHQSHPHSLGASGEIV